MQYAKILISIHIRKNFLSIIFRRVFIPPCGSLFGVGLPPQFCQWKPYRAALFPRCLSCRQ